jgi:hypothetical protein
MGIWLSISSKVYIYDSRTSCINHWTSAGAFKVSLWHGSPLKTIDRDITVKNNAFYLGNHTWGLKRYFVRMIMPEWFVVADLMIATSEKVRGYFNSAFGCKKIEVTGYPRNDIISNPSLYAKHLVFEQNTQALRNRFLNIVNPYMEQVQSNSGLSAFRVVMDDSNNTPDVVDRNQLVGQIFVQPTRTAEFIVLDFVVQPTGATFPE